MKRILIFAIALAVFTACGSDDKTTPNVKVTNITLNKTTKVLAAGGTFHLSVAEVLPADATDKGVTWDCVPTDVATVDPTGLVAVLATAADGATATITATAKDGSGKTATCGITVGGVLVNGVTWARCNVGVPGTFVAVPEAAGMLYQWNRRTGWSSADPVASSPAGATWDAAVPTGDTWDAVNDPCPAGWRMPTEEEYAILCDAANVFNEWTTENSANGRRFTDNTSENYIFLPAAGSRNYQSGALTNVGSNGNYWSSISFLSTNSYYLNFSGTYIYSDGATNRAFGYSVRCVAE